MTLARLTKAVFRDAEPITEGAPVTRAQMEIDARIRYQCALTGILEAFGVNTDGIEDVDHLRAVCLRIEDIGSTLIRAEQLRATAAKIGPTADGLDDAVDGRR